MRTWLYCIATNRWLNALRAAGRRISTEPVPPFEPPEPGSRDEIAWLQTCPEPLVDAIPDTAPAPEARYEKMEAIQLAFVAARQRIPPWQTATLGLRDVLGFSGEEVAGMLNTSPTAVKGMLQRARATLAQHRADAPVSSRPDSDAERDTARRFAQAWEAADIDGVIALLTDDAWLSMPPAPHRYQGLDAIATFLRVSFGYRGERRLHFVPTRANGQPAFGTYLREAGDRSAKPAGLLVLGLSGHRIHAVTRFHVDELYPRFGLPEVLTGS